MAIGSETFVAGEYTITANSVALGIFEGDAGLPTIEHTFKAEPIANTSSWGKTTIDGVYVGGDYFAAMICLEYKAGPISSWWPHHATLGRLGAIGQLLYAMAVPLIFTAIAGTPAASSPATLTASKAVFATGFNTRLVFGPTLRKLPLRFQLLPYVNSVNVVFSTT